jgi:hypothetical protein
MEQRSLLIMIRALPKVLQNLISEYNVEHRVTMNPVMHQLLEYQQPFISTICAGCNIKKAHVVYTMIAEDFVCSLKCLRLYVDLLPDKCPNKHSYDDML